MNTKQDLPIGWDADRVRTVATHYEEQSSDQAVAEDTAASKVTMEIPTELVPEVRRLLAEHGA